MNAPSKETWRMHEEHPMTAEQHPANVETDPDHSEPATAERPPTNGPEVAVQPQAVEEQQESRTKGMLREAIQKVMQEIEYHEKEAQKHLRQAASLRKDLRESVAFLQEQGGKSKPPVPADKPGEPTMKDKTADLAAAAWHQRASVKKRPASKKSKGK